MGSRAGLERCGEQKLSCTQRESIPEASGPQQVAVPTALARSSAPLLVAIQTHVILIVRTYCTRIGLTWLRTRISDGILWKSHLTNTYHKKGTSVPVIT